MSTDYRAQSSEDWGLNWRADWSNRVVLILRNKENFFFAKKNIFLKLRISKKDQFLRFFEIFGFFDPF